MVTKSKTSPIDFDLFVFEDLEDLIILRLYVLLSGSSCVDE